MGLVERKSARMMIENALPGVAGMAGGAAVKRGAAGASMILRDVRPTTVFIQPKTSSTRLRTRWLIVCRRASSVLWKGPLFGAPFSSLQNTG